MEFSQPSIFEGFPTVVSNSMDSNYANEVYGDRYGVDWEYPKKAKCQCNQES